MSTRRDDWDRVEVECDKVAAGLFDRCDAATGGERCHRHAGHPGCHYVRDGGALMRWGPGKKVGALYPRKKCA